MSKERTKSISAHGSMLNTQIKLDKGDSIIFCGDPELPYTTPINLPRYQSEWRKK